jgi:hypothetical protein
MGRDSNPRYLSVHTLSRRAQSTALAPILQKVGLWIRMEEGANEIAERRTPIANLRSLFLSGLIYRRRKLAAYSIHFGFELVLAFFQHLEL